MPSILLTVVVAAACALGAALAVPARLEELDAVNFALGLDRFDLARSQPHFPGYPVYWALARLTSWVAPDVPRALAWPAALLWVPAVLLTRRALLALGATAGAATAAALLLACCPGWLLEATKPTSDATGAALLLMALSVLLLALRAPGGSPPGLATAGLLLGLVLGVRLSYAPFVLSAAALLAIELQGRALRRAALLTSVGLGAGTLAWLVPLAWVTGPGELWRLAHSFSAGHLGAWGGTALTRPGGRLPALLQALGHNLGLGQATLPAALCALVLAAGLLALGRVAPRTGEPGGAAERRGLLIAAALAVPYLVWVALGQNLERPRHLLPVALLVTVLAGLGAGQLAAPWTTAGGSRHRLALSLAALLLVVPSVAGAAPTLRARPALASTHHQVVTYLAGRVRAGERVLLFGGQSTRLAQVYLPSARAQRPGHLAGLRQQLHGMARATALSAAVQNGRLGLYVTSDIDGVAGVAGLVTVARFAGAPTLYPEHRPLALLRAPSLEALLGPGGDRLAHRP